MRLIDSKGRVDQQTMKVTAVDQARGRALRGQTTCCVYRCDNVPRPGLVTWWVRSEDEGAPDGVVAVLVYRVNERGFEETFEA